MNAVRTRFAPSPTGFMHVGGARTALFAWLVARQHNGQFLLRLEDTDKTREVSGADQHIMDSLNWLGLHWDEGPDGRGDKGPYRQSQRLDIYRQWAERLCQAGRAYADTTTPAQLDELRARAVAAKRPFLFRDHRPSSPPTWEGQTPLRFKSEPKPYNWHDEVMGDLSAGEEAVDDFIIIKSDGFPTYNFAHIVDDHLMEISHVIRSQEFLASMPRFLNLYEALDLLPPLFATLPYVMGPDGKKKLSKRDGAKDIMDYAKEGFLPEGMINFLATLGWNDGTEQEVYSIAEIIERFKLERVQRSGARFDEQRLLWLDGAHIRKLELDELYKRAETFWPAEAKSADEGYKKQVLALVQERLKYLAELPDLTRFFFVDLPINADLIKNNKQLGSLDETELKSLLEQSREVLNQSDFSLNDLTERLNNLLSTTKQKPAVLFSLIRIATTQAPASPSLAESLAVLGKDIVLKRIDQQLAALG